LRSEQARLQGELRKARATLAVRLQATAGGQAVKVPEWLVEQHVDADPSVQECAKEVTRLELMVEGGQASPERERELRAAKAALAKRQTEVRDKVVARLRNRVQDEAATSRAEAEENIKILQAQLADLQRDVERQKQLVQGIGKNTLELELKRAEIDQIEALIKTVRAEKERLGVELQSASQRITEVHEAEVPKTKNTLPAHCHAGVAGLLGLLFGALWVAGVEHLTRRLRGGNDLP
jgi:chromosome segregation ATPase